MDTQKQYAIYYLTAYGYYKWGLCVALSARAAVQYIKKQPDVEEVLECYQLVDDCKWK